MVLRDDDGQPRASTGLVVVQVSVDRGEPFDVVGVGGVIVAPRHRGQGLGRTVMEAALDRAPRMGPLLAMLFCRDAVAGVIGAGLRAG